MIRSHKIRLYPNQEQENILVQSCGTARFVFNWGLARWQESFRTGEKPNALALKKKLNALKATQFPWMYNVSKCVVEGAFQNLNSAYSRFFTKQNRRPRFKKKHGRRESFYISNDKFRTGGNYVKIPKIKQKVRMAEPLRFDGKIMSGTVSRTAGRWFLSIAVEIPDEIKPVDENQAVGIDLGLKSALVTSYGEIFNAPKPLKKFKTKLRQESKSLSRKEKFSNNWKKQVTRLANLHWRIANTRNDWIHKTTTEISRQFSLVFLENLNVKGMMANHKLAKAFSDVSLFEVKRQFSYKTNVRCVDRFFPSSKLCSHCDHTKGFVNSGFIHTNSMESFWANMKRGIIGSYHHISPKYLQTYIDEFSWRFSNRKNENIFHDYMKRTVFVTAA